MHPGSASPRLPSPWGEHELSEGTPTVVRIGPIELWFETVNGEIRLAHRYPSGHDLPPLSGSAPALAPDPENQLSAAGEPPDKGIWSRWATPGGETRIRLVPGFPDRTLVLQPELPFRLLPRAEARIFVRVPLWVRIELPVEGASAPLLLTEIPAIPMSDTWWGGFMEGELTYWLPTKARRVVTPELYVSHMAICTLQLRNRSTADLEVSKLAFRVAHLALLLDAEDHFWSSESRVNYHGEAEGSQIDISERAPVEAGETTLVLSPRTPLARGFRARTFERLRVLPGLGGSL